MTIVKHKTQQQGPLEILMMTQLTAIRQRESNLQQQFQANENAGTVVAQLVELQQRAERLNRMIDAMNDISMEWTSMPPVVLA